MVAAQGYIIEEKRFGSFGLLIPNAMSRKDHEFLVIESYGFYLLEEEQVLV